MWIDSDDHDRSSLLDEQETTVDMPTSGARGNHASVESDRSRSPAERHTPAEPALRRQAVHESLRPMTYGTLQALACCAPLPDIQVGGSIQKLRGTESDKHFQHIARPVEVDVQHFLNSA